jgi:hypothetical protein
LLLMLLLLLLLLVAAAASSSSQFLPAAQAEQVLQRRFPSSEPTIQMAVSAKSERAWHHLSHHSP